MNHPINMSLWTGRIDADEGALARRWHERISAIHPEAAPGVAILGFACDAGVQRNQGRPGAKHGPTAIRKALAGLAWHHSQPAWEAGDVVCEGDALEAAQAELSARVAGLLDAGHFPIVLGGGHEIAFGSHQGLAAFAAQHVNLFGREPRIGIINFDAHFDLRGSILPSSGTPFRQIAEATQADGNPFHYLVFGIAETGNTEALFHRARELGVEWHLDNECTRDRLSDLQSAVEQFASKVDWLYLTVCLDVLPGAWAPGVSAPAALGVEPTVVESLIQTIKATGKLKLADIAELNPDMDIDSRTAKLAARLVWQIAK
ncbi:formimidoylglutamase [Burkholderiaceae bacterium DAT-1]|nr:formimidoylglutamase [Burkholderiaceae bacterium DAT-1]